MSDVVMPVKKEEADRTVRLEGNMTRLAAVTSDIRVARLPAVTEFEMGDTSSPARCDRWRVKSV